LNLPSADPFVGGVDMGLSAPRPPAGSTVPENRRWYTQYPAPGQTMIVKKTRFNRFYSYRTTVVAVGQDALGEMLDTGCWMPDTPGNTWIFLGEDGIPESKAQTLQSRIAK